MDLQNTVAHFLGLYPDYNKLRTVNPLHAYPLLYGLTFQKNVFVQMGMSWSRLVPLSLREMCLELDQVRSQVRSRIFPEGCTLSNVRFLTHVRSENLVQTNSVSVLVELTAATYPIRALDVETASPPLKKQCLYVRDDFNVFRPIHLESGDTMELYELQVVRSSCESAESEQAITLREWTKRFPHYDVTKFEIMKLHFGFTRFNDEMG